MTNTTAVIAKTILGIGGMLCCVMIGTTLLQINSFFHSSCTTIEEKQPLFPVRIDGRSGYIDKQGNVIIQTRYQKANEFNEDLAAVAIKKLPWDNPKWGYITRCGEMTIQPQFDNAYPFNEGLAIVSIGSKYGFIDRTGKIIVQPQFDKMSSFRQGVSRVVLGSNDLYIDHSGRVVEPEDVPHIVRDMTKVELGGKWGFADRFGNLAIEPKFDSVGQFSEGLAVVEMNKK